MFAKNNVLRIGIAFCTLTLAAPAMAALPPYWQTLREYEAVLKALENGPVKDMIAPGAIIDAIERVDSSLFRIRAGTCAYEVRVIDKPRSMPGPRSFELKPGRKTCR